MVGARRKNICKFFSAILAIYSAFYKAPNSSLHNLSMVIWVKSAKSHLLLTFLFLEDIEIFIISM